jgi:hypothetical protein
LTRPNARNSHRSAILDASANANVRRIGTNLRAALNTTAASYPAIFNMLQKAKVCSPASTALTPSALVSITTYRQRFD